VPCAARAVPLHIWIVFLEDSILVIHCNTARIQGRDE
jgi:hypothetical protein